MENKKIKTLSAKVCRLKKSGYYLKGYLKMEFALNSQSRSFLSYLTQSLYYFAEKRQK